RTKYSFWEDATADDDGMLGGVPSVAGFSHTSRIDLRGSRSFLAKLGIGTANNRHTVAHALEGGAGKSKYPIFNKNTNAPLGRDSIGRVTNGLLHGLASHIDVIEPVAKFNSKLREISDVRHIFNVGLEEWSPADGVLYDLVWIQWCTSILWTFLMRCGQTLNPKDGVIVVKENISTSGSDYFDAIDSSQTREDSKFRKLITQAGLRIIKTDLQKGLPTVSSRKLLPVRMYALKPISVGKLVNR
ncbi:uncharacterized protein PG986_001879, partial [Apiospora aurea]